jgi:alanine racemase
MRTIPAGSLVSYGCTYKTTRDTTIAILPVGYYDGYSRRLSNKGIVGVCVKKYLHTDRSHDNSENILLYANVLGRVCMNVIIIDITDVPSACCGDEVILLGDFPELRAHDIARRTEGFNPREVTTILRGHIPRVLV